ncbi:single-stranded-DNA-specific exonuclease RecJ [Comamonas jiangduensis]|uniref:single-stranded-DNA-specific exonuclease RecJ n=1 Tax=Comamonas jiangduensis TaxID=1194168 RepID=UPI0024E082BD|nr:single-stranded-DNA-specific exonuclease RecJ [Comamonas jiangduensis]
MKIIEREIPDATVQTLVQSGINPLLARLYVARGVQSMDELDTGLGKLLPPSGLRGIQEAACVLADAIAQQRRICIVADYDCDGATACAVGVRGLRMLGAQHVTYEVPDRINDGYGLSAPIARRVHAKGHELLLTVDNGIGSVEGVAEAMRLGLTVVVTDHHLPGETLPTPHAMVNPNQPGCTFASKHLAGVGVMFYVLLVLRAELRTRGVFNAQNQPKLDTLLPLVALGTVADVVKLDANNRRLVAQGLQRIRKGHMQAGIRGLYEAAGKTYAQATTSDFGFALGPRINAAGRLADMTIGIECLLTDDDSRALELAHVLTRINRDRQEMESGMRMQAFALADELWEDGSTPPAAISVFDLDFHEGVVGIVASRVKDRLHRPTFVFAASQAEGKAHELKGSGRSIPGFHLRDALDLVAKRHPGVLLRFGGHAMAAGCTLVEDQFHTFERAFAQVAQEWLDAKTLTRCVETDGPLDPAFRQADVVERLNLEVWGQGFAAPTFSEDVEIISQRLVAEKHLKLQLRHRGDVVDGIWFGRTAPLPDWVHMAFRLDINEFRGERKVQFLVEGTEG